MAVDQKRSHCSFVVPLGPAGQAEQELKLAQILAAGKSIEGGIFLTSKDNKFSYIRCEGDTEVPLVQQVPSLKSHDRDLGPKRLECHRINFVKANTHEFARLFARVLKGCQQVQIDGVVQQLNVKLDGAEKTFPAKLEKYEQLVGLFRDIVQPDFRYFTRHQRQKPWMWVPLKWPPQGAVVTLADVIHNGHEGTAVQVELPKDRSLWPGLTLVRRTDTGTVHTLEEISKCVPDDAITSNVPDAQPVVDTTTGEQFHDFPMHHQIVLPAGKQPLLVSHDNDELLEDFEAGKDEKTATEAQDEAQTPVKDLDENEATDSDEEEGDSDAIEEVGEGDDDEENGAELEANVSNQADEEKTPEKEKENKPDEIETSKAQPASTELNKDEVLPDYEEMFEDEIHIDENPRKEEEKAEEEDDEEEVVISGQLGGPQVQPITVEDNRPVPLRRLHMALPNRQADIPDGMKKRLAFSLLVLNIRKLGARVPFNHVTMICAFFLQEIEYNESVGLEKELPELDEGKTLNQREMKRELKHLLELMSDRDQWLSEQRVKQTKAMIADKRKKATLAGRKKEAQKAEANERERLSQKANTTGEVPNDLRDFDVVNGPHNRGLDGFGSFLRQKKEKQEKLRRQKERQRLGFEPKPTPSRNSSIASSTGSAKPLTAALSRLSRKKSKDKGKGVGKGQSSALRQAPSRAFKEINDVDDEQDDDEGDREAQQHFQASSFDLDRSHERKKKKDKIGDKNNDSVFAMPKLPKGYVKADTLRLMKEMYRQQNQLITTNSNQFAEFKKQIQSLERRQKRSESILERTGSNFSNLQKAFFDYDIQANQELCDIEAELLSYLPVDELGERTDFIFSDPSCAKTIVKHVRNSIRKDGTGKVSQAKLVNETARKCFSVALRAHMHIVKRQWKQTVGWWRVQCPATFQLLIEKYIIPIAPTRGAVGASVGWRKTLYSHFKNTGDNYFNHKCKATSTQTEYVAKRRRIRIALQKKHFNPEVEGRPLNIPKETEVMERYAKHSEFFEDGDDLINTQKEKSQRGQQTCPGEEGTKKKNVPPLPSLAELHALSERLRKAIEASVNAQKQQKSEIAVTAMANDDEDDSSEESSGEEEDQDDVAEEPATKKAKIMNVSNDRPAHLVNSRRMSSTSTTSSSSTSSKPGSSVSPITSDFDDDDVFPSEAEFQANLSKFSVKSTQKRASPQASTSTSTQVSQQPKGKPKAFAKFHVFPQKRATVKTKAAKKKTK